MSPRKSTKKIFVLDTNVLLHDPNAIFHFKGHDLVIPITVIEEMDVQKRRQDEVGRNARRVAHYIDDLRVKGKIYEGVPLENGGILTVEMRYQDLEKISSTLAISKADNRILAVAVALQAENPKRPVILVTKDTYLRIKADVFQIATEDYRTDKVDINELYTGTMELNVTAASIDKFYAEGRLIPEKVELYPNQFVTLVGPKSSALGKYCEVRQAIVPLTYSDMEAWGIKARNKEQRYAMELLMDDDVQLVTLVGQAGTGKTLLALAAGLQKVVDEEAFKKLLVSRPVIPLGNDIGFLPGSKDEKLRPWMSPIYDNFEFLLSHNKENKKKEKGDNRSNNIDAALQYFKERGQLELEAITYIRGRTIPRQYMIVDEAQNLTPHEVKTILTRAGQNTKIVLTGDPYQIDNPYLDTNSNGLTYVVERFKGQKIAGHVTFTKCERSELATLAAELI